MLPYFGFHRAQHIILVIYHLVSFATHQQSGHHLLVGPDPHFRNCFEEKKRWCINKKIPVIPAFGDIIFDAVFMWTSSEQQRTGTADIAWLVGVCWSAASLP